MYSEIAKNKRKTIFLIVIFAIIVILLGWCLGYYWGDAGTGIILATIVATVMTLLGYFRGDTVSLAVAKAKPVTREEYFELYNYVENLSITAGLPMPKIYVIDDPSPNAFATGRDPKHASIAVTSGLLNTLERTELEGVLAHELSHIQNYDIRVMTLVVVLVGVIILLSDIMMRSFIFGRGGSKKDSGRAAVILFLIGIVLTILSPLFAELIKLAVSRNREYLADASAAMLTRYPEGLAWALEKISAIDRPMQKASHATAHLYIANPFQPNKNKQRFSKLFSTHPPIEERVKKLRSMI
ncbi:MAG: zinc metalloprotease HtpX [Candidatus Uhrbacteria bacterium]